MFIINKNREEIINCDSIMRICFAGHDIMCVLKQPSSINTVYLGRYQSSTECKDAFEQLMTDLSNKDAKVIFASDS